MLVVYGIPNCDMVKKATAWLKEKNIAYNFHNFKTDGISSVKLREWINNAGVDVVVNKRSTTWRNLPAETQSAMSDPNKAIEVAMKETSLIKRPVVESNERLIIGFDVREYQNKFG